MTPACHEIRRDILKISHKSKHGHIPTCFSVVEALVALYETIRHDPNNPQWDGRDIFILSKGHASLALYCVLARFGYFSIDDVYSFGAFGSKFGCHVDRFKVPGVEASTGSLGHGIGLAVGMALAQKLKKTSRNVYVLIGDGESNEGSVWEAIMVATNLNLDNLTVLYDNNQSQLRSLPIPNPSERLRAFGCDVAEVDGHDVKSLKEALVKKVPAVRAIVANTTKGFGCKTFVNHQYEWHRRSPNDQEVALLLRELDEEAV